MELLRIVEIGGAGDQEPLRNLRSGKSSALRQACAVGDHASDAVLAPQRNRRRDTPTARQAGRVKSLGINWCGPELQATRYARRPGKSAESDRGPTKRNS